ncbi:MAG: hypothetical protein PHQ54_04195 [Candidatus Omnitrophica bacterium]|nr:hypothetical protein [Candidatus Omnitrophota bacterium]
MLIFSAKIRDKQVIISFLLFFLFLASFADAQNDKAIFKRALRSAKNGKTDFAFCDFHLLVELHRGSFHYSESLFAVGEYYFATKAYGHAKNIFLKILDVNPASKTKIFVKSYLLEIAKIEGDTDSVTEIRKSIISSEQLSLLFRDFKEYAYVSPMFKSHRVVYFIDRIEFFIDDKLFSEIYY